MMIGNENIPLAMAWKRSGYMRNKPSELKSLKYNVSRNEYSYLIFKVRKTERQGCPSTIPVPRFYFRTCVLLSQGGK